MKKMKLLFLLLAIFFAGSAFSQTLTIFNEGFEGGTLPTGWTTQYAAGTTDWAFNVSGGITGVPAAAHSGSYNARFYVPNYTHPQTMLITPKLNLSTYSSAKVKFWHTQPIWAPDQDSLEVYYRIGLAGAWNLVVTFTGDIPDWQQDAILFNGTFPDSVYIGFKGYANYGYGICLDDVTIEVTPGCSNTYIGDLVPTVTSQTAPYSNGTIPYWKFNATAGSTYFFSMCSNSEDSKIRIYDANTMVMVDTADDSGPLCSGLAASIGWTCPTSGDYYISASHYNCDTLQNSGNLEYYYVTIPPRACDSCAPQDAGINTFPVVYDNSYYIQGTMGNAGKFTALFQGRQGKVYHFDLCPSAPGDGYANFDVDIKITDSICNILTGQDGSCGIANVYRPNDYAWTCPANGKYYVVLARYRSYNQHNCTGSSADSIKMYYYEVPPVLTCPVGATPENEPLCDSGYVDVTNGGCNSTPSVFTEVTDSCSQTFCSQSGTYQVGLSQYRDTDWYRLLLTRQRIVKWEVAAEFPFYAFIIDGNSGCSSTTILAQGIGGTGDTISVVDTLAAGTYYLWVGPSIFTGIPAGMDYIATYSVIGYAPVAAGAITGTAAVCSGATGVSYTVTAIPGITTYNWSYTGTGATIHGTGNSVTIDFATNATNGILTVRGYDGCLYGSASPNFALVILPLPNAAGTITGPSSVCQGASGSFSVPVINNAISYIWTYSGTGATITGSSNTVSIAFANNATSGVLRVKGHNNCGDGIISADYPLTINPLPGAAGTITGLSSVCAGQSGIAYTVPLITDATAYSWSYSGVGATFNGAGNSITIDFAAGATGGNLTVRGSNTCGNGTLSVNFPITILQAPSAAGTISGQATVCRGNTGITYTVPPVSGATSYIWTLPAGFSGTSSTNSINIDFDNTAITDTIFVKGTNTCGPGAESFFIITVGSMPDDAGTITGTASVCWTDLAVAYSVPSITGASTYQWNFSGTGAVINGSGASITIDFPANTTSGDLTVRGHNTCGNGAISAAFHINVSSCNYGITETESGNINIKPNPNKGSFDIEIWVNNTQKCTVKIMNSIGQIVADNEYMTAIGINKFKADLTGNANGIYYVQINTGNDVITKKVILSR